MKAWMIIGLALVLLGLALFALVMTENHWNFNALSTVSYETNLTPIREDFHNITVQSETARLHLLPAEDGLARVECYEETKAKHSVTVENGTLFVRLHNEKKWYEYVGVNFETPEITVYLPGAEYGHLIVTGRTGDVSIPKNFQFESIDVTVTTGDITCGASAAGHLNLKANTGDIFVTGSSAASLDLAVTTGRITARETVCQEDIVIRVGTGKTILTDLSCKNLSSDGNTGDITLTNVIASEKIEIERSTGDVTFDASDAAALDIETDTGKVTGTLLSDKIFLVETDTGRINIPQTTSGGRCKITTDTGDIRIKIAK